MISRITYRSECQVFNPYTYTWNSIEKVYKIVHSLALGVWESSKKLRMRSSWLCPRSERVSWLNHCKDDRLLGAELPLNSDQPDSPFLQPGQRRTMLYFYLSSFWQIYCSWGRTIRSTAFYLGKSAIYSDHGSLSLSSGGALTLELLMSSNNNKKLSWQIK